MEESQNLPKKSEDSQNESQKRKRTSLFDRAWVAGEVALGHGPPVRGPVGTNGRASALLNPFRHRSRVKNPVRQAGTQKKKKEQPGKKAEGKTNGGPGV